MAAAHEGGPAIEVDPDGIRHLVNTLWQAVEHAHPGRLEDGEGCGSREAVEAVQQLGSWYTAFLAGTAETIAELAENATAAANEYAAREDAVVALTARTYRVDWSPS